MAGGREQVAMDCQFSVDGNVYFSSDTRETRLLLANRSTLRSRGRDQPGGLGFLAPARAVSGTDAAAAVLHRRADQRVVRRPARGRALDGAHRHLRGDGHPLGAPGAHAVSGGGDPGDLLHAGGLRLGGRAHATAFTHHHPAGEGGATDGFHGGRHRGPAMAGQGWNHPLGQPFAGGFARLPARGMRAPEVPGIPGGRRGCAGSFPAPRRQRASQESRDPPAPGRWLDQDRAAGCGCVLARRTVHPLALFRARHHDAQEHGGGAAALGAAIPPACRKHPIRLLAVGAG